MLRVTLCGNNRRDEVGNILKKLRLPLAPSAVDVSGIKDMDPFFIQESIRHLVVVFEVIMPAYVIAILMIAESTRKCAANKHWEVIGRTDGGQYTCWSDDKFRQVY